MVMKPPAYPEAEPESKFALKTGLREDFYTLEVLLQCFSDLHDRYTVDPERHLNDSLVYLVSCIDDLMVYHQIEEVIYRETMDQLHATLEDE